MFDFVLIAEVNEFEAGKVSTVVGDDGVRYTEASDDVHPKEFDDLLGRDL